MKAVSIVFPHQLYQNNLCIKRGQKVILVEESLFFLQYRFHKQKIVFHRASMKFYVHYLQQKNIRVEYIEARQPQSDVRELIKNLHLSGISEIHITEVSDNWLNTRIRNTSKQYTLILKEFESPLFLNYLNDARALLGRKKRFFQTKFYI